MKKFGLCTTIVALLLVFSAVTSILPVQAYAAVSAADRKESVRVFVGDLENAPGSYAKQRLAYLHRLAKSDGDTPVEAIVGFDDYYALEEVSDWLEQYHVTAKCVYMWAPGDTGRLGLFIENGDIPKAVADFCAYEEGRGAEEDDAEYLDYQRFLNGEFGVFALTVIAPAGTLDEMAGDLDSISYVDVKYNEQVERYAAEKGKDVSYIELPSKPDGAL